MPHFKGQAYIKIMKKILIAILMLTVSNCFSQGKVVTIEEINKLDSVSREDDGIWRIRYDNNNIMREGQMKLFWCFSCFKFIRLEHGEWRYYDKNGKIIKKFWFDKGTIVKREFYDSTKINTHTVPN